MSAKDIIKTGDYVKGNIITTQGGVETFAGFVDFIARSHIQLHTGFIVPLIPQKYVIEKVDNVVSIHYWQTYQNLINI